MKTLATLLLALLLAATCRSEPARAPNNLFTEQLGKSKTEIDAKIDAAWQQLFHGNDDTQRLYYPVGDDMAYIADIASQDVRSEGMSYGMMIAVQLDKRAEFDRLWKWAKTHMYHAEGSRRGYFAWQCRYDGTQIDPGSASDGEEWFAMALLFASHRWGNGEGIFNYAVEAQALLDAMRNNDRGPELTAIFNAEHKQVVFAPTKTAALFTDPSYHLPAFYELWARWDKTEEGRNFWAECAKASRAYFHRAAHPKTGLMSEYAEFDGSPRPGNKGDFRYDAWRTIANPAVDYAWFGLDPWQKEQANRVLTFLSQQGPACPNQFTLDGKPLSKNSSAGLFAMAAVGALAAEKEIGQPFVQRLWDMPVPAGKYRYYDGLLYFLGFLQVSGRFQIHAPATNHTAYPSWNKGEAAHQQLLAKAHTGKIDLYFLGDSITRRWGALDYPEFLAHWKSCFHGWNAADFGWGGDSTHNILWRIQNGELDGVNPKVIVLLAGTNNIGKEPKPDAARDAAEGIAAIIATCQAKAPKATIVLMAIFPRNDSAEANKVVADANLRIATLADGKNVRFININDQLADKQGTLHPGLTVDNLHLSLKGYEIWAKNLKPVLTELLGPPAKKDLAPPPTGDIAK